MRTARPLFLIVICSLAVVLPALNVFAQVTGSDILVMKDGKQKPGLNIVSETYEAFGVDTTGDGNADTTYPADEVAEVKYGDRSAIFRGAELSFNRGLLEDAVKKFTEALAEEGARKFWLQPHANYMLGECYRRMAAGRPSLYADAIKRYEAVARAVPKARLAPRAKREIGRCCLAQNRIDAARPLFEQLASGQYGDYWVNHGKIWLSRVLALEKKFDDAQALLREVAAAVGDDVATRTDASLARGEVLRRAGKFGVSKAVYEAILQEAPETQPETKARAYNGLGDLFWDQGRTKEALLAYLHVRVLYFDVKDELPRAVYSAAVCFGKLKEAQKARQLYQELVTQFPGTVWAAKAQKQIGQ